MKSKANVMALKSSDGKDSGLDKLKWSLVFILVLAGLFGNHYYTEVSMLIRTVSWLAVLALAGLVASTTYKGKKAVSFCRDAQMELRKVVWPSREETIQTTMIVGVMVAILALFLWGMDGILVWLIGWLTGQRG